ncbi:ABC transporter permease [Rhabdobacter roseus]|uniref:Putative ABC transport system permease protein n=1 Tax=Rhabdobacter roseus TaxID=1655419 RepID=A0A840TVE2_9BACT|nr:ABC transporter permease [Rhabdobacter roseus]MBB5285597.1 putative ABC transport system permease protein [Rhabdobacter roseus]
MIQNYLKIAWRGLRRSPIYGLLNIFGLAIGLTCGLLIATYVLDELSYDRFHQHADRIAILQQYENVGVSGGKLATDFKRQFAQVENVARLKQANPLLTTTEAAAYEEHFFFADSSAFSVFTLPLRQGNPATALVEQYGVVVSESMAQKYFPGQDPMGKTIQYDKKHNLRVTGVMRDLPGNSHHKIDFLANYANANELLGWDVTTNLWAGSTWTYLLLVPGTRLETLAAQFPAYLKSLNDPNVGVWKLGLIPLTDLYLRTDLIAPNRQLYVTIFSAVALLILALAAFNYVNLATARATQRAREVGVRKVLGSSFGQLWRQFLGETVLFISLALMLMALLVPFVLPTFNEVADKQLTLASIYTTTRVGGLLLGAGVLCLLAGGYPAFVLSSFKPSLVLKGTFSGDGTRTPLLRKVLVVGQFTVSIVMIVATLVVYSQLRYVQTKDLGYQREQVLVMNLHDASSEAKLRFRQEVQKLAGVESATQSYSVPGSGALRGEKLVSEYKPAGAADLSISRLTIDEHFLSTFNIKLLQGRNLDANRLEDRRAFLINEAAMKYFGWENLDGKTLGYYTFEYDPQGGYREVPQRGPVVGLVADYHQNNLKSTIPPLLFSLNDGWEELVSVKIRAGDIPATLGQIEQLWKQSFQTTPFDYEFLDDFFQRTYQSDLRAGQVFGLFAALAILISSLGLFGLGAFAAERRTKEIGVRKVLGASVGSIVALLSVDFLKLVLIALVIASPIAYYFMYQWLQNFAYRTDLHGWVFLVAAVIAVTIAFATVSYQAIKAALMNPVKSLRSE